MIGSKEQGHFLEDELSEQGNQLIEKDGSLIVYLERVVVLKKDLVMASAKDKRFTTQHTVDKDLLNGVHTNLALHRIASRQRLEANSKDREMY